MLQAYIACSDSHGPPRRRDDRPSKADRALHRSTRSRAKGLARQSAHRRNDAEAMRLDLGLAGDRLTIKAGPLLPLAALAVFVAFTLFAARPATAGQARIEALLRAASLGDTRASLMAVDLTAGRTLLRLHADRPMIPASNMKLITSAAALDRLGADHVFRTELRILRPEHWRKTADQAPGENPDLLIKGDGDPAFGDPELLEDSGLDIEQMIDMWVDAVRRTGVRALNRIIVDDRIFDRTWVHPDWPDDQLQRWYCAQVAGLNFHNNCLDLYPEPTRHLESPRVRISPLVDFIPTRNRAKTDNRSDSFWAHRKSGTNKITFYGKVKRRYRSPVSITIHQPPLFFGQLLAERLVEAGISVREVVLPDRTALLPEGRTLHAIQTTLPLVLARCNKDSQNLFAEALIKRLGHEQTGAPGSWKNGAAAVRIFLRDRLGARAAAIQVADGSGMSRNNAVTARLLIDLLADMHQRHPDFTVFRESLSVAGEDGTLRRRLDPEDLDATVIGKSGYLNGVSSLSGYVFIPALSTPNADRQPGERTNGSIHRRDTPGGAEQAGPRRVLAFSLLFNGFEPPTYNHHLKTLQDQIVSMLIDQVAPAEQPEFGG